MSEKEQGEPLMSWTEAQEYLKDQFTLAVIQRMRAEPGMEWFSPDTPLPDEAPE